MLISFRDGPMNTCFESVSGATSVSLSETVVSEMAYSREIIEEVILLQDDLLNLVVYNYLRKFTYIIRI